MLLEGDVHREIRRGLAEIITQGRPRVTAALPDLMARYVEPMDVEGHPDWIEQCFAALVSDLFCRMCDCPDPVVFPRLSLTRLFDRFVGLNALDEAERQIGVLRQATAASMPHLDSGLVVALFILGRDSLLGTLATSLHSILRQNLHRRFADIEFPDFPPETGVAIAERIAITDIPVASQVIATGERVRMYFQPISAADSAVNKQNLFGAGAHSCLGRPISLDVWRAMIDTFKRFRSTAVSLDCEFEPSNVFVVPRHLKIGQSL